MYFPVPAMNAYPLYRAVRSDKAFGKLPLKAGVFAALAALYLPYPLVRLREHLVYTEIWYSGGGQVFLLLHITMTHPKEGEINHSGIHLVRFVKRDLIDRVRL